MSNNKGNLNKKRKVEKLKRIYEKYMNVLSISKRKQDQIVENFVKSRDNKEIEKIREKLNSN